MAEATATIFLQPAPGGGNTGSSSSEFNRLAISMDNLASRLSTLDSALKSYTQQAKSHSESLTNIKSQLANPKEFIAYQSAQRAQSAREAAEIRANMNTNPQLLQNRNLSAQANLARNNAALQRQNNLDRVFDVAGEYRSTGNPSDKRFAQKLELEATKSVSNALNKGIGNSKIGQFLASMGGAAALSAGVSKYMSLNTQAGMALEQNPLTNGYNYGGTLSTLMNVNQGKQNLYVSGVTGALAAGAAFIPGAGLPLSAAILAGGQMYNSYKSSDTAIKAQAASTWLNNTMSLQSLRGTDQAAAGLANPNLKGHSITDVQMPLILAMSKAAGVYTDNAKQISKLTNYAVAAQLSLGQVSQIGSGIGYFSRDKSYNADRDFSLFSSYGISDYGGYYARMQNFTQGGMSVSDAQSLAAKTAQANPGFLGEQQSYYSSPLSNQGDQQMIAKMFHVNLRNYLDTGKDPQVTRSRNALLKYAKTGNMKDLNSYDAIAGLILEKRGILNLTQVPLHNIESKVLSSAPQMTKDQASWISKINQFASQEASGMTIGKAFDTLNGAADNSSKALDGMSAQVQAVTAHLSEFNKVLFNIKAPMGASGGGAIMSGSTGHTYNKSNSVKAIFNNGYADKSMTTPGSMGNQLGREIAMRGGK